MVKIGQKHIDKDDYKIKAYYNIVNQDMEVVGRINIIYYCLYNMTEMEYLILPQHQNQGYATQAVRLVLKDLYCNKYIDDLTYLTAFGKAQKSSCDRIILQIDHDNIASLKVAKRNGFKLIKERTSFSGEITRDDFKKLYQQERTL